MRDIQKTDISIKAQRELINRETKVSGVQPFVCNTLLQISEKS